MAINFNSETRGIPVKDDLSFVKHILAWCSSTTRDAKLVPLKDDPPSEFSFCSDVAANTVEFENDST